jgi:hypothetical protein
MANFEPNVEKATEAQLLNWINTTSPQYGSLASDELTRRSLHNLQKSIKEFDKSSSEYSTKVFRLTLVMFLVALIQLMVSVFSVPLPTESLHPLIAIWIKVGIWAILLIYLLWQIKALTKDK